MSGQFIKKHAISICLGFLCLTSLSACLIGYWRLDTIPYGFHVDELSGSVDIGCMATEAVDAHNVPHPLFSNIGYGTPKPPTYIYPAIVWAKMFGYSVPSLRALSVTVHIAGIIGLFLLANLFFGWRYTFITVSLASLSPWTWNLSRIAFESLFSTTFLIWGIYLFFKPPKIWNTILAGLLFVAAMYSYPPFRLQTPLMLLSLVIYSFWKNPRPINSWISFSVTIILSSIPLIQRVLNGEIQKRFENISIFSKEYLNAIHSSGQIKDIIAIFIHNFLLHFKWEFLFTKGDPSYVHSTRHFGILSWMDMAALGFGLLWIFMLLIKKYRKNNPLVLEKNYAYFLSANILIGVLPAALTNSELPNSLRITGAWAFVCLMSGFLLWQACERWWGLWILTCVLTISFAVIFFNIYFRVFPAEGKGMFAYWTMEQASELKTDEDWLKFVLLYHDKDYTARYFLMQNRHLSCSQSMAAWKGIGKLLNNQ